MVTLQDFGHVRDSRQKLFSHSIRSQCHCHKSRERIPGRLRVYQRCESKDDASFFHLVHTIRCRWRGEIELGPQIMFAVRKTKLIGSYGYRREHLELLARLVAAGRLDLSGSISSTLPLEAAADGVEALETKRGDPVRIVLVP